MAEQALSWNKRQRLPQAFVFSPYPCDIPDAHLIVQQSHSLWPLGASGCLGRWARNPSITEGEGMRLLEGLSGINALLKPHPGWSMPKASLAKEQLLSFNCYYFQFFFLGKKEIGLHYTLIMCEFFINIIIHPQQLSKQAQGGYSSQVASEEQREDLERYAIRWACPWIMILLGISLGLISTESSTDFRPYRCCPILLGGRAGVRDWVLVLMVMVMF